MRVLKHMHGLTPLRFCLVANELSSLDNNGGIGTHNQLLADRLASAGWQVHVLYCGPSQLRAPQKFTVWYLKDSPPRAWLAKPCTIEGTLAYESTKIYTELRRLHELYNFQLIEFADWLGNGFRTVQAKRMGLAFADAKIMVRTHSSSQWCREANHQWMNGAEDLVTDYIERYAFENSDLQVSPCRYMLDAVRDFGWAVRQDARVIPYVFPEPEPGPLHPGLGRDAEIVFFGRLEFRKGLSLFVDAIESLPKSRQITFLGKQVPVEGIPARAWLKKKMRGRKFKLLTDLNREQAIAYLKQGNRLAVLPSLQENYPFTLIECATNGIPFIASRVGGIPEIINCPTLADRVLFAPRAAELRRCLDAILANQYTENSLLRLQMDELMADRRRIPVAENYAALISAAEAKSPATTAPLVTLGISHFNLGEYLPTALEAVAAQTYPSLQVIVVDDGSNEEHLPHFARAERDYPQFTFLRQTNHGLGNTRNRALALAEGKYFIPLDADNISRPAMVERFVGAMEQNPKLAAVTCFNAQFVQESDIARETFRYCYRPLGGPLVVASMDNVFGDANAIFRTAELRAVGGFETDRGLGNEDWEVFVKLNRARRRTDVIPETLFLYRFRENGMWNGANEFLSHKRVLRQFFADTELPLAERLGLWTWLASGASEKRAIDWKTKVKGALNALRKIRN